MDSIKIQFLYTYDVSEQSGKAIKADLMRHLLHAVPDLYELNNEVVSAALSLDIKGIMKAIRIHHPDDNVPFRHVEYERIKDHQGFRTRISLKSEVFKILDLPVIHGNSISFVGIEGAGDRIKSYKVTLDGRIRYIVADNSRVKPKRPLRLTG